MKHHSILPLSAAVLGLLPLSSFAATQTVDGIVWEYKVESRAAVVTGVRTKKAVLAIPALLGGFKVETVDPKAFAENTFIVSLTIPQGVKRIGNRAFENCVALETVTIPGSVTNIGKRAFAGCGALSSVVIGKGVAAIGKEVFADCVRLSSIAFPASVTTIGDGAFLNCRALSSLNLGSVATVGDNAFLGCSGLKAVVFPGTLRRIGASAFANCSGLLAVSIPETVTVIGPGAFSGCFLLEYALLPTSYKGSFDSLGIPGQCVIRFWDFPDISYIVKFNANGGTGKMSAQRLDYGCSVKLQKNTFTRADYVFAGWSFSKTGAIALADEASVRNLTQIGGTVTVYAQWAKKSCAVKFYANGGSGKMATQKLPFGVATTLSANKFTRSGYVFRGWSKTPNGSVVYKDKKSVKNLDREGRTIKLYAQWAVAKYKVSFCSNDGKNLKIRQTIQYGKSTPLRKNTFEVPGHRFMGWSKTANGAVAYADGASVKNLRADGKTVSLYAIWKKIATTPAPSVADAVDFSLLKWSYGGFKGGSAKIAKRPRISSLSVSNSGMSYAWTSGGCEDLGASSRTDASCVACLFCLIDGKWVGGKFDWISTSRRTRDFKNIQGNYNGWPPNAISRAKAYAFVIVSRNGRERTNVIRCGK